VNQSCWYEINKLNVSHTLYIYIYIYIYIVDPAVEKFKRDNKGNKEDIVEPNEIEQGSKAGKAASASEIGLTSTDWGENQEFEGGFLRYPYQIKETIEHKGYRTGAQSLMLLHDLMHNFCHIVSYSRPQKQEHHWHPTVPTYEARQCPTRNTLVCASSTNNTYTCPALSACMLSLALSLTRFRLRLPAVALSLSRSLAGSRCLCA
jgi:hypothetical protein